MNGVIHLSLALVAFSVVSHGNHDVDHHHDHHDRGQAVSKISDNTVQFATELYKILSQRSDGKNIIYSPCSISILLSVLLLGSKSKTHTEILEGLSFNLTQIREEEIHQGFHELLHMLTHSDHEFTLDIGQGLFLRDDIQPLQTFLEKIKEFYEAEIQATKFQEPKEAEKQINDYIEKKTHGKIVQLVKDLDIETRLVLTTYSYFKGNWKTPFDPQLTNEEDFFVDQNTTVKVQMMHREGWFNYYIDEKLSCTVVGMDYNGTATAIFVLPDPGKEKELEEGLSGDILHEWGKNLQRHTARVSIPKLNLSATYSLKDPLGQLGITELFTDHADLSGITEQPLKLSKVTHKVVLTVDEGGTEAAAATAGEAVPMSLPPKIVFNHPFLMFLIEKSVTTIITMAKIINPTQQ
ncbi:alpha-1-antitrypsin-like [Candoia aspera]|uniref:alpha-1-antitrypsin-like n=1 Tax=Candoia aspera TaxID=51853 RepID=UPI002FD8368A